MCEGHHDWEAGESCCCESGRHGHHGGRKHHRHHGWGHAGHHQEQDCCGGHPFGFHRRFPAREEEQAELEQYLKDLEAEAKGVQERLAQLRGS